MPEVSALDGFPDLRAQLTKRPIEQTLTATIVTLGQLPVTYDSLLQSQVGYALKAVAVSEGAPREVATAANQLIAKWRMELCAKPGWCARAFLLHNKPKSQGARAASAVSGQGLAGTSSSSDPMQAGESRQRVRSRTPRPEGQAPMASMCGSAGTFVPPAL